MRLFFEFNNIRRRSEDLLFRFIAKHKSIAYNDFSNTRTSHRLHPLLCTPSLVDIAF